VWIRIRGPCLRLMDANPAIFVIDLQDANRKLVNKKNFFCLLFFEGAFTVYNFQR
jgi:hypothetical protein